MADVVVAIGLGFGDEGKGGTIDFLTRRHGASLVVRFCGGAQAAHNVVEESGRHHCFSQWGSGTLAGAKTLLSRFMMVNPTTALNEARRLTEIGVSNPLSLLHVELGAPITTPFHMAANRCKEALRAAGGVGVHGSCGMGIGETMADILAQESDNLLANDLVYHAASLRKWLRRIQDRKLAEITRLDFEARLRHLDWAADDYSVLMSTKIVDEIVDRFKAFQEGVHFVSERWLDNSLELPGHVLFEGAQGVLLDQDHGFQPHTTWSDCTYGNANLLLRNYRGPGVRRLGILRAFHTRHGAGPFPTESEDFRSWIADDHNTHGKWQGAFRAGAFDLVLAKYALHVAPECDELVFTHLDKLRQDEEIPVCTSYDWMGVVESLAEVPKRIAESVPRYSHMTASGLTWRRAYAGWIAERLDRPIAFVSYGPKASDREVW